MGNSAVFWVSDEYDGNNVEEGAKGWYFGAYFDHAVDFSNYKYCSYSVRCVMD